MVLRLNPKYIVLERKETTFSDDFWYEVSERPADDFYITGGFSRSNHILEENSSLPIVLVKGVRNVCRDGPDAAVHFQPRNLKREFKGLVIPLVLAKERNLTKGLEDTFELCRSTDFRPSLLQEGFSFLNIHKLNSPNRNFYAVSPRHPYIDIMRERSGLPEDLLVKEE